jgi:hypothetical protein
VDALLLLLLLWVGLILTLWGLEVGLDEVEDSLLPGRTALERSSRPEREFDRPDAVAEVIGTYMEEPIYRRVTIDRVDYEFDHIDPPDPPAHHARNERCLKPGIVYVARQGT